MSAYGEISLALDRALNRLPQGHREDTSVRVAGLLLPALLALVAVGPPSAAQSAPVDPAFMEILPDDVVDLTGVGHGRVDRMRAIAALEPAPHALLTTADAFPDALASGVLQGDAMLLGVTGGALDGATQDLLRTAAVSRVTILGGVAAVPEAVSLGLDDLQLGRLSGADRTATAVEIAMAAGGSPDVVLLARARGPQDNPTAGFVDALGAGAWAAMSGYPILLIEGDTVSPRTAQAIAALDPQRIVAVGGAVAISDATLSVAAAGRSADRVAGPERFSTAAAVAAAMRPDGAATVFLLDGTDPDAWASGFASARPAALRDGVVLLSDGDHIPAATAAALAQLEPSSIHCLATVAACLTARHAAGMPEAPALQVTPPTGQPLAVGTSVDIRAGGDLPVVDDGGCLRDGVRTGDPAADCTVVIRVHATPSTAAATATLTWPALTVDAMQTWAAPEYTSPTTGGRWDYDEAVDGRPEADRGASRGARVDTARSALIYGPDPGAVPILWAGYGGAARVAPDGLAVPLDSTRFTKLVVRLYTEGGTSLGVEWRSCSLDPAVNCIMPDSIAHRGYASASAGPGWQTVTLDMAGSPGWSAAAVHTIYLSAGAGTIVDDIRLTDGTPTTPINVTAAPGVSVVWDTDADPSNNTDVGATTWGVLADGTLDPDVLPPGEYHLHTISGDPTIAGTTTGPVHILPGSPIAAPPPPATEWARDVRGNPWDFAPGGLVAGTDDIIEMGNATRVQGPGLTAVNSNTTGDPHFMLDVPTPIDSRAFQTITVHFTVDGPFDLSYGPGGGTHGRILYQHGHNTPWRNGN
ncbi:MAG TPA: cell wall-binding repeat-containing protein, partial [Euzebya sp.]|nr:cell wall-binding repeat-containing protein [Euzebya sp.]